MYKRNMLVNYSLFQVQIILWWYSTLPDYLLSQKVWFLFPGMICPIQCLSALDIKFWRSLLFLWPQLLTKAICEILELLAELIEFIISQQTSCDLELLQELIDHPTYCNQELLLEPVDSPINWQTSCILEMFPELIDFPHQQTNFLHAGPVVRAHWLINHNVKYWTKSKYNPLAFTVQK